MIDIILEDLNDKTYMATNISITKLYRDIYKQGYLFGRIQKDGAGENAKKMLPEICFSRSDFLPQKIGVIPTQTLKVNQLIKVILKMDKVMKLRGVKKQYPVSYGNANKEKAGDTELRGEERIQIKRIPATREYMTIYIPEGLFEPDEQWLGPKKKDNNKNVAEIIENDPKFKMWIDANTGKDKLFQYYKDTSRASYKREVKAQREREERKHQRELEEKQKQEELEKKQQQKRVNYFNY